MSVEKFENKDNAVIIDEKEKVVDYISTVPDLTEDEIEMAATMLNMNTINAFEEAMEKVAAEANRERTDAEIFCEYIVDENKKEKLVSLKAMLRQNPENITEAMIHNFANNLGEYEELEDIVRIDKPKDSYFYSSALWTSQFAETLALLEEKDILEAIATRTRRDCKIYPRPVRVVSLKDSPYNYSDDEILGAIARMTMDERYSDIKTVIASNGGVCIYSTEHMSEKYARSLCESIEVEWKQNQ